MKSLRHSLMGLQLILTACTPHPPIETTNSPTPTFESRYLYDMRQGDKLTRSIRVEQPDGSALTQSGAAYLNEFIASEAEMFPEVRQKIYGHYAEVRAIVRPLIKDPIMDEIMPEIRRGTEIDQLVALSAVAIAPEGKHILLMYETEWDVEHGLNILITENAIAEIGLGVDVFLPSHN